MSQFSHRSSFHFVQVWQESHQQAPTIQQRVLAVSPEQAIVHVMKEHHLKAVARAYVSRTALDTPSFRIVCVIVKGNKRSWKQELPARA
jgi:hypothetical protein